MRVFHVSDDKLLLVRFDVDSGQMDSMCKKDKDWKKASPAVERMFFRGDGELSPISEQDAQKVFDALKAKK